MNIRRVEELILKNTRIAGRDISSSSGVSVYRSTRRRSVLLCLPNICTGLN
jgi:hypothetical protein